MIEDVEVPKRYKHLHDSSHPKASEFDKYYYEVIQSLYLNNIVKVYHEPMSIGQYHIDKSNGKAERQNKEYFAKYIESISSESEYEVKLLRTKNEGIINSIKEKVYKDIISKIVDVKVPKRLKHLHDSSHPKASELDEYYEAIQSLYLYQFTEDNRFELGSWLIKYDSIYSYNNYYLKTFTDNLFSDSDY